MPGEGRASTPWHPKGVDARAKRGHDELSGCWCRVSMGGVNNQATAGYSSRQHVPMREAFPMKLKDPKLFRQQCYVDGTWVEADDRESIPVNNPADNSILGTVPKMGADETRRAIEAAERALPEWRARTGKERAAVLRRLYELMMANQEDLAQLMTAEQGKPLTESRGEIVYAASFIEWFGEEGKRIYGDTIPGHMRDKRIVVLKQPIGVCAAITPWNFPAAMITRKMGPA